MSPRRSLFMTIGAILVVGVAQHATAAQEHFASPDAAVTALVDAARAGDEAKLIAILGPEAKPVLGSGDPVADKAARERFAERYDEAHEITNPAPERAVLEVGDDDWPFPFPIVYGDAGWSFDTSDGVEEILARRVGRNELAAIQTCLALADAQLEYYERDPDGDGLRHYARRLLSSPGEKDGLYWPTEPGQPESPIGPLLVEARAEGYKKEAPEQQVPYHGYYFRLLESQGPHAAGGAYSYVARGVLLGGFAVVAYPATYGNSGVMTFMVNQDGVVYEKDLGPDTAKLAAAITSFDPDDTWEPVSEEAQEPETEPGSATAQ